MEFLKHIVAAASLIQNQEGKILLVKTIDRGWEIPGGAIEEGEDIISALKREVKEEADVDNIEVIRLSACYSSLSRNIIVFDFVSKYNDSISKSPSNIDEEEIVEVAWFSKDEVLSKITDESMLYRVKWLLEDNKTVRYSSYFRNPFKITSETVFEL